MRQHHDVCCHGTMDAADRCSWINHAQQHLAQRLPRFPPRRSLSQKRHFICRTAVERIGHQADVLVESSFCGHLKLPSAPSAHLFPGAGTEGVDGVPLKTAINRRIKGATVLPELLEVIVERGQHFNHANTSHAFNRLAKLYRVYGKPRHGEQRVSPEVRQAVVVEYVEPAIAALTELTQQKLHEYEPWDVATSLWAAAVLKLSNAEVVDNLLVKADQLADSFMPADVANVLWACAKMQMRPKQLLKHLIPVSVEQMQLFKPKEVAMLAWAYAKLDYHPSQDLLESVADHTVHNVERFSAQETANVLWAMARFRYRHDEALQCIEQRLLHQVQTLTSQDVSNALWACAKIGFHCPRLFEELGSLVLQKLDYFKPQELGNVVYAHAVLQHHNSPLLEAASTTVTARMAEFSCQELVNVLWSFGRLRYFPMQPQCLTGLLSTLVANRVSLTPQALANTVKSMAKLKYCPDPKALDLLAACSINCISEFKPTELTNLLWGYATLGVHHQALFDASINRIQALLTSQRRQITSQHINSVLYSCEALGFCPRELLDFAEAKGLRNLRVRRDGPSSRPAPRTPAVYFSSSHRLTGGAHDSSNSIAHPTSNSNGSNCCSGEDAPSTYNGNGEAVTSRYCASGVSNSNTSTSNGFDDGYGFSLDSNRADQSNNGLQSVKASGGDISVSDSCVSASCSSNSHWSFGCSSSAQHAPNPMNHLVSRSFGITLEDVHSRSLHVGLQNGWTLPGFDNSLTDADCADSMAHADLSSSSRCSGRVSSTSPTFVNGASRNGANGAHTLTVNGASRIASNGALMNGINGSLDNGLTNATMLSGMSSAGAGHSYSDIDDEVSGGVTDPSFGGALAVCMDAGSLAAKQVSNIVPSDMNSNVHIVAHKRTSENVAAL